MQLGSVSFGQKPVILPLQQHKLLYADTVHRQAIATKDSLMLAEAYYLYGKTYEAAGDLLTSQRWFLKSLAIIEPRGSSFNLSRLYFRLAINEQRQGHYTETLYYARLSIQAAQKNRSPQALSRAYSLMGTFYQTDWSDGGKKPGLPKPKEDSTHYYWRLGQALLSNIGNDSLVLIDRYLATAHRLWVDKKDLQAISYLKKALALAVNKNETALQIRIMQDMAGIYLNIDNPKRTWQLLQKIEHLLTKSPFTNSYNNRYSLEGAYRDYYLKIGDWRQAYQHSDKQHALERNNYIADRDGAVTRLGLEYETEKKNARLKAQQKELVLRSESLSAQQRFIWAMAALLLVTGVMLVVFFQLYRKNQRISAHNAELVKEQNHRVKNNLQIVSSLLNLQANRLTDEATKKAFEVSQLRIEAMAILHRRLYDGDQLTTVNLAEFIPELVDTVLQTFGYSQVQPVYELSAIRVSADQALSVGLILTELATNACKYAFPDHSDPMFRIACQQLKNQVDILVADNGPGMLPHLPAEASSKSSTRFGLRLIQLQVDQLRGTHAYTNQSGTLFTLNFPVNA